MPRSETLVMLVTVVITVATSNLAYGVIAGALTAMVLFTRRVAHLVTVQRVQTSDEGAPDTVVYRVTGELFFASSNDLVYQFNYVDDPHNVVIDMSESHIWDASTVAALDAVTTKYRAKGKDVEIIGLNTDSADRHDRLSGTLGSES
jgi:SulP family sulfate permease